MSDAAASGPLEAFRRLLADARDGGQAKVDALVALSQRRVLVATWTDEGDDYRTLINGDGQSALPLFTDADQMNEAGRRYGWIMGDAPLPHREIGARAALQHVVGRELDFLVVDITADHCLEAERTEIEPLLQARSRSDSRGPYAGVGRISSSMLRAVRASSVPPAGAGDPAELLVPDAITVMDLPGEPPDLLLEELSAALRGYPEVEWALYLHVAPSKGLPPGPALGLRIDQSFRDRLPELVDAVASVELQGVPVRAVLLDEPALVRTARPKGLHFYPFRRRG